MSLYSAGAQRREAAREAQVESISQLTLEQAQERLSEAQEKQARIQAYHGEQKSMVESCSTALNKALVAFADEPGLQTQDAVDHLESSLKAARKSLATAAASDSSLSKEIRTLSELIPALKKRAAEQERHRLIPERTKERDALEFLSESWMREICMSSSMRRMWKRSDGSAIEAPPDERCGNR